jgi:hypothetical protein
MGSTTAAPGLTSGSWTTGTAIPSDDGPGIDGAPEDIARLFSINRPMVSTKLLRLPTRGALGNGLRVVTGAVLASGGSLVVTTRNRRISLRPEYDGSTTVLGVEPVDFPIGTSVEVVLGDSLPWGTHACYWATIAEELGSVGMTYRSKSSPWWYDAAQFRELLYASGNRPVREIIANLDGCTGGRAGEIVAQAGLDRAMCSTVTLPQAVALLEAARANAKPVTPKRLGAVGPEAFGWEVRAYAVAYGTARFGAVAPFAEIPFVVEVWAKEKTGDDETRVRACVNRTPVTGALGGARDKRDIDVYGCSLSHTIAKASSRVEFDIWINVTTPYMPITSDGKAPDLEPFLDEICAAASKVVRKSHTPTSSGDRVTQKDIVLNNLDDVVAEVSGEGRYRFGERQLLYQLRPIVQEEMGQELQEANFKKIITEYEAEHGEIPGMYREPRGTIYHPHREETITLGTLMVEEYERPVWTFNKLVYIEKEGFSEALKDERWAERHDCALLSSKGFSTRAARDLIDLLAAHNEPVTIFCVHDADAAGTMIYQTLQQATKARGARKIRILNLGLEPWGAVEMELEIETLKEGERRKPVAEYITEAETEHPCEEAEGNWAEWLQTHRVELNAMTTPEFIEWLDGKMAGYSKLVPPEEVLGEELDRLIRRNVTAASPSGSCARLDWRTKSPPPLRRSKSRIRTRSRTAF